jgi:hypothetical protein
MDVHEHHCRSQTYEASVKLMSLMGASPGSEAEATELPISRENWSFKSNVDAALREVLKHEVIPHADG